MELVRQQKQERKLRILARTRELIGEQGYAGITVRQLAERCGVSVPTLYNLFGSKDALLARAVEGHFEGLLETALQEPARDGCDRILEVVGACAQEMARLSDYHRALLEAFAGGGTQGLQESLAIQLSRELRAGLAEMRAQRHLGAWVDLDVLAQQVTAACISSSVMWARGLLDDRLLRASMLYGAAMLVLGGARGNARVRLESCLVECQAELAQVDPARVVA